MRPQDRFGQSRKDQVPGGQNDVYNQISNAQPSQEDFSTFEADNATDVMSCSLILQRRSKKLEES